MRKIRGLAGIFAAMALLLGAMATSGQAAAVLDFDIGIPNSALSTYTGPYAHVDVAWLDTTHATITVTSLSQDGHMYLLGGEGIFSVNVNASAWTVSGITGSNALTGFQPFSPKNLENTGSGNISEFGAFNQTFKRFDGYGYSLTAISFNLLNTGGTWASVSDILANNASGYLAAAHIFVNGNTTSKGDGALVTGFAGNGTPGNPVPEPGTMLLLGSGLVGLAGWGRTKFRK